MADTVPCWLRSEGFGVSGFAAQLGGLWQGFSFFFAACQSPTVKDYFLFNTSHTIYHAFDCTVEYL